METADLQYHMFTRAEMDQRYARAREKMEREGIDALLVTGEENFQYLAGTAASIGLHYSLARQSVFILPIKNLTHKKRANHYHPGKRQPHPGVLHH